MKKYITDLKICLRSSSRSPQPSFLQLADRRRGSGRDGEQILQVFLVLTNFTLFEKMFQNLDKVKLLINSRFLAKPTLAKFNV